MADFREFKQKQVCDRKVDVFIYLKSILEINFNIFR